jgi:excisionase family DNA binding protein
VSAAEVQRVGIGGQSSSPSLNGNAHLRPVVPAVVLPGQRLIDVPGAARYLAVSRRSVFRMLESGTLKPVRLPGVRAVRVDLRDLERLVEGGMA